MKDRRARTSEKRKRERENTRVRGNVRVTLGVAVGGGVCDVVGKTRRGTLNNAGGGCRERVAG